MRESYYNYNKIQPDRASDIRNMAFNFLRVFCKYMFTHRSKLLIIFLLTVWMFSMLNMFFVQPNNNGLAQEDNILVRKEKAALLSERLQSSFFMNSKEWSNISMLLQDIWGRLDKLEKKVETFRALLKIEDHQLTTPSNLNQSYCMMSLTNTEFPHCNDKIKWMETFWSSDPCYASYGVDGSTCSIRRYLGEVESWCPPLPEKDDRPVTTVKKLDHLNKTMAKWNKNLSGLMDLMKEPSSRNNYEWIHNRIVRLWHMWLAAVESVEEEQHPRTKRKILIYLGFLSRKSGFHFQQTATAGGPLGELVQWSDILSALYILGHEMIITSEYEELTGMLNQLPEVKSQCQARAKLPFDMIVTDIVGLTHFKKHVKQGYGKFSCLLRIIDTFGTEASYNSLSYAKQKRAFKTSWGMQELNLKQFYTMFPHSPDNSFMGFVVEQFLNTSELSSVEKKQRAVVYGKSEHMWSGKEEYLSVISRYVEIHATVFADPSKESELPKFVKNHGIMSGADLQRLLFESKLFIGLGFPYEGPAPLEAIAAGCVFINPKFNPPHSSKNTKFFKGKPTGRELTSQHPYAEDFIGEPHVFTVDISNLNEVELVVKEALKLFDNSTIKPYLPFEFTHKGMLQRLNAYLEHQNFCPPIEEVWPSKETIIVTISKPGQSCKDACWNQKLICEPAHFKTINTEDTFDTYLPSQCTSKERLADVHYPAMNSNTKTCVLQSDNMLFSCVDSLPDLIRMCPCRKFVKGQMALCPDCL